MRVSCSVELSPEPGFNALLERLEDRDLSPYTVELIQVNPDTNEIRGRLFLQHRLTEINQLLEETSARKASRMAELVQSTLDEVRKAAKLERMIVANPVLFKLQLHETSVFVHEASDALYLDATSLEILAFYLGRLVSGFLKTLRWPHGTLDLRVEENEVQS